MYFNDHSPAHFHATLTGNMKHSLKSRRWPFSEAIFLAERWR